MKKRIITLCCLVLATVLTLCSCTAKHTNETTTSASYTDKGGATTVGITLPYASSDSMNPFLATGSENTAAAFLFCQPLFEVKSDYTAEAVLAETYSITANSVTVTVKSASFSDGSNVSANDVVYSFNKAKTSSAYAQRLSNIQSAKTSGGSVVFTLASPDRLVLNVLTFPVVKSGTAEKADSVAIGSGVFVYDGSQTLQLNSHSQKTSAINTVTLYDVKKLTYITNELEIGNINYLFEDFSDGSYKRIVAENKTVTLNNLVYIGINSGYQSLASSAVRTAIYYALDKETISASAYQGYSKTAVTPFNPDFAELSGLELPTVNGDGDKCENILEKTGYNRYTKTGSRTNGTYNLEYTLLVNSDNSFRTAAAQKIADSLTAKGIVTKVEAVNSAAYQQKISSGAFQLYLGEIKLTENQDLTPFVSGAASVGIDKTQKFFSDYQSYRQGNISTQEVVNSFLDDMVFVPVCYRAGMAAYSKAYTPDFTYAPNNIYGNIENWEKAK